jgi:DNA-binding LacI/PurR family transcriptional regulator
VHFAENHYKEVIIMTNRQKKIVIAAPTFNSPFQAEISRHIRKWFKPEEIVFQSVTDDSNTQKECLNLALAQSNPFALIAISVRPDKDTVAAYTAANVPIVLIDEEADGTSTIATDNFLGGHLAGEYLAKKGRKKIGVVSGRTQVKGGYNADQRVKGFRKALDKQELFISPEWAVEVPHYSTEAGVMVMPKMLDIGVDAIFCAAGDNCALGLLTVAKQRGIRIPEDVAIVSFDDLMVARVSTPRLTTIRQPLENMAEAVHKMVVLHGDEILRKPQKAIFAPELVVRQSA